MARSRRVASRAKLNETKRIVLADDVTVTREKEIVDYVLGEQASTKQAALHFECGENAVRGALRAHGVKRKGVLTLWESPPPEPVAAE